MRVRKIILSADGYPLLMFVDYLDNSFTSGSIQQQAYQRPTLLIVPIGDDPLPDVETIDVYLGLGDKS